MSAAIGWTAEALQPKGCVTTFRQCEPIAGDMRTHRAQQTETQYSESTLPIPKREYAPGIRRKTSAFIFAQGDWRSRRLPVSRRKSCRWRCR